MPKPRAVGLLPVCLTVKPVGKPDAGNRHVRFDERGWETERCRMAQATAPLLDSTTVGLARPIRRRQPPPKAVLIDCYLVCFRICVQPTHKSTRRYPAQLPPRIRSGRKVYRFFEVPQRSEPARGPDGVHMDVRPRQGSAPAKRARPSNASSMRSASFHFAMRSERENEPTLS